MKNTKADELKQAKENLAQAKKLKSPSLIDSYQKLVESLATTINGYSGKFYVHCTETGKLLINKSFHSYGDAKEAIKEL